MEAVHLERFFENSVDLHVIASSDGKFLKLSDNWVDVLGYTMEELTETPFIDFIHPNDIAKTAEEAQKLVDDPSYRTISFTNRYRTKKGEYITLHWKAAPVNGILYATARLEEQEDEIIKQVLHYTHDLSNVLSILQAGVLGEIKLDRIAPAVERAIRLTRQLRGDFEKEAYIKRRQSSLREVDLESIKQTASRDFNIDLEIHCEDDSIMFCGTAAQVQRLINNLIENASRAQATKAYLEIEKDRSALSVSVKDNGNGMTEEELSKIGFGYSKHKGGRGVQIVRDLVHELGGTVTWNSIKNIGTVCNIKLKQLCDEGNCDV